MVKKPLTRLHKRCFRVEFMGVDISNLRISVKTADIHRIRMIYFPSVGNGESILLLEIRKFSVPGRASIVGAAGPEPPVVSELIV